MLATLTTLWPILAQEFPVKVESFGIVLLPLFTDYLQFFAAMWCEPTWEFGVPLMENFIPAIMVWDAIATKHD